MTHVLYVTGSASCKGLLPAAEDANLMLELTQRALAAHLHFCRLLHTAVPLCSKAAALMSSWQLNKLADFSPACLGRTPHAPVLSRQDLALIPRLHNTKCSSSN